MRKLPLNAKEQHMRALWTILTVTFGWLTVKAFGIALNAASDPHPELSEHYRTQYVNVAWTGFIVLAVITAGLIWLAVRAFKRHNRSH